MPAPTLPVTLQRLGELGWSALRELLLADAATCAWSDYSGFQLAPALALPDGIPPTTHLWAWGERYVVRARLDVDRALVAALAEAGGEGEQVQVAVRRGHPWSDADVQIGRADAPLPSAPFELLELTGASPATFVRGTDA